MKTKLDLDNEKYAAIDARNLAINYYCPRSPSEQPMYYDDWVVQTFYYPNQYDIWKKSFDKTLKEFWY